MDGSELTYILKRTGPSTEPCGTPYKVRCASDNWPLIKTFCFGPRRKDLNHWRPILCSRIFVFEYWQCQKQHSCQALPKLCKIAYRNQLRYHLQFGEPWFQNKKYHGNSKSGTAQLKAWTEDVEYAINLKVSTIFCFVFVINNNKDEK